MGGFHSVQLCIDVPVSLAASMQIVDTFSGILLPLGALLPSYSFSFYLQSRHR